MTAHFMLCTSLETPNFVGRCVLCGATGGLKLAYEPCPHGGDEPPRDRKGKIIRPKWAAKYKKGWDFTRGRS